MSHKLQFVEVVQQRHSCQKMQQTEVYWTFENLLSKVIAFLNQAAPRSRPLPCRADGSPFPQSSLAPSPNVHALCPCPLAPNRGGHIPDSHQRGAKASHRVRRWLRLPPGRCAPSRIAPPPVAMFMALPCAESLKNTFSKTLTEYGRVPLCYFLIHLYLIHRLMFVMVFCRASNGQTCYSVSTSDGPKQAAASGLGRFICSGWASPCFTAKACGAVRRCLSATHKAKSSACSTAAKTTTWCGRR